MRCGITNTLVRILICGTVLGLATAVVHSQDGEWRSNSGDPGSRKYSPLDQITKQNVRNLKIFAPKGTRLHVDAHFNNSVSNKFNPDPSRTVYRGRMTWEEMMSPFFAIITNVKTDPKTILKLRGQTRIDNGA